MLFYANGSKEKNGIVPIMGRVTINGTVAQFSCKRSITKELWDAKGNRAKGKSVEARETNLALDNIKAQIIKHYQRISDREAYVTAEMVRNAYQGIGCEYETILGASDHIERKTTPKNADPTRTHLNRELVQFPDGVADRTEAISHRIRTAGIKRKITPDQVRAIRIVLSGTHEDMARVQDEQQQAERQLDEVRKEIKSEKLEAAKTEAKAALVAKVGSLLGSGKLKELEADNRTLQGEVAARDESIELLQQQMERQQEEHSRQLMELQSKHRREMADKETAHQKEVSFLKSIIQKAKKWFPLFQELVYMEEFCLKVGFNERQTATLISGKPLFYEGELYSEEHRRKFMTERAGFQVVKDPADKSKLALAINGQVIGEWFKEQFDRLFSSIRKTVISPRKNKGIGL